MMKDARELVVLEALAQNLLKCKNARRRVCVFLVVAAVKLGLENAQNELYIICLARFNQLLNWFYLNEAFCTFAKLANMEVEGAKPWSNWASTGCT